MSMPPKHCISKIALLTPENLQSEKLSIGKVNTTNVKFQTCILKTQTPNVQSERSQTPMFSVTRLATEEAQLLKRSWRTLGRQSISVAKPHNEVRLLAATNRATLVN